MTIQATKKNKKNYNAILFQSIDESLSIITDDSTAKIFFSHLQKNNRISGEEIGQNIELFSSELEKFFGVNALKIEKMIVALLYSKLGIFFQEKEEFNFENYIKNARTQFIVRHDLNETRLPFENKELALVYSLQEDARKTVTKIAEEIGLSRPTVTNMLDRLNKRNILQIKAGINLKELRFPTACIALENKTLEQRKDIIKKLSSCPRVLLIVEPSERVNMLVFIYGENQNTLMSTIECIRSFSGSSLINIYHSGPPQFPSSFNIPIFIDREDNAPCGRTCNGCVNYETYECVGCPTVKGYKGPL